MAEAIAKIKAEKIMYTDKKFTKSLDAMIAETTLNQNWEKQFIDTFKRLLYRNQSWRIWSDFIEMSAIAVYNVVNSMEEHDRLEKRYLEIMKAYEREEIEEFPKLLAILTQALEDDPEQDFLGKLFQQLELSNHWRGQFFTPYNVCWMMAKIQTNDLSNQVKEKGYVSVNDPACGAGALLIAFANAAKAKGVNYQKHVLFVGQDIDRTAALMCYLQLSLLGCAGYVIVGDTLRNPPTNGLAGQEVWYTPMYFSDVWKWRGLFQHIS